MWKRPVVLNWLSWVFGTQGAEVLTAVIGTILLILLAATAARYSISHRALDHYDRLGVCVFFIVVGIPFAAAGALLIAHYVANPTS
jgi:hypothetical protein